MDTQEILPEAVVETVGKIHLMGAEQYKAFTEKREAVEKMTLPSVVQLQGTLCTVQ